MSTLRKAAQQALEALESCSGVPHWPALQPTITALRAALAQPEPRNQCGETCERATLCAVCAREVEQEEATCKESLPVEPKGGWQSAPSLERRGPVAWMYQWKNGTDRTRHVSTAKWPESNEWNETPLYTHPPRREWQAISDDDIAALYVKWDNTPGVSMADFARAIEQAHGIA